VLHIDLLGRVSASVRPGDRQLRLTRQSATALAYLAATRGRFHPREHLVECFWPNADVSRGRANLASAIWRLRRALPAAAGTVLSIQPIGDIGFDRNASISLDSELFERSLAPAFAQADGALTAAPLAELRQALTLYCGEYMPGWYDDWVLAERERLHALHFRGRMRLLEHCEAVGNIDAALECGFELLKLDPLRESVHRRLMLLYSRCGEQARVVAQYRLLVNALASELGVAPSRQTEALYRALIGPVQERRRN
jgi:DNA-binding SARP family transcriptional activator